PLDTTPPVGGVASQATSQACQPTRLEFSAATDAGSPIHYRICWSKIAGDCADHFTARATVIDSPLHSDVTGLEASTQYYFLVRAEDPSGNVNANTSEVPFTTAAATDATPPVWQGAAPSVAPVYGIPAARLDVSFTAAKSACKSSELLKYGIC